MKLNSVFSYDTDKYHFRKLYSELIGIDKLEEIRLIHESEGVRCPHVGTMEKTNYHRIFYDNYDRFSDLYFEFIGQYIRPSFDEKILIQKIPTFRTHFAWSKGDIKFHRDIDYSHSKHESNFYLPLTNTNSFNTLWIESQPDLGDYSPDKTTINYGKCYGPWSGVGLFHGTVDNDSDQTRLSIDFRLLFKSKYKINDRKSFGIQTPMIIGEYWTEI